MVFKYYVIQRYISFSDYQHIYSDNIENKLLPYKPNEQILSGYQQITPKIDSILSSINNIYIVFYFINFQKTNKI